MRDRLFTVCLFAAVFTAFAGSVRLTTTIDYLDYAFYDHLGPSECYTLESYEQRIRELAECGITQINLRTNCMGVALHPSKILPRYGEDGRWHYTDPQGAARLIETLKHYDPLAETIRLGHKYGMQVWCWENITDESFRWSEAEMPTEETRALARKFSGYPFMDPFLFSHEECWAWLKAQSPEELAAATSFAMRYPVARMVIKAYRNDRPAINFGKDDLDIYFSDDNVTWTKYNGGWTFTAGTDDGGYNFIDIADFSISAKFIKLAPKQRFPKEHPFSLALKGRSFGEIYNTKGEKLSSDWGCNIPGMNANQPEGARQLADDHHFHAVLEFDRVPSMGFDANVREIGCAVGGCAKNVPFLGMLEFCNPVTMEHKLRRYSEYAAYGFDGYILTMNCHSNNSGADEYSYNPAVRQRILQRTGKDIMKDEVALEELIAERRDGLSEYIEGCKKLIGDRPLYVEGWGPGWGQGGLYGRDNFGSIYPDYKRLIRNGTICGVLMYHDFADYFTDEVTGGRKIDLGMYYDLNIARFFTPLGQKPQFDADFDAALTQYFAKPYFNVIDLYETLQLTEHKKWQEFFRKYAGK